MGLGARHPDHARLRLTLAYIRGSRRSCTTIERASLRKGRNTTLIRLCQQRVRVHFTISLLSIHARVEHVLDGAALFRGGTK